VAKSDLPGPDTSTVERGSGLPLVLIPGLQGRWEYMRRTVDALAAFSRVITFPLCDEPAAGCRFIEERGLDNYVDQVVRALDERHLPTAVLCGVSFGGIVALRCAARHPARVSALVVVSAPGPGWHLKPRHEIYTRVPWLFGPFFLAETPWRLRRELKMALPALSDRLGLALEQLWTLATAPVSVSRMAQRARLIASFRAEAACALITTPTLIVHGEPALDHVVEVEGTSRYASLIAGSHSVLLTGTGHLGSITRPLPFAATIRDFVCHSASTRGDPVGSTQPATPDRPERHNAAR